MMNGGVVPGGRTRSSGLVDRRHLGHRRLDRRVGLEEDADHPGADARAVQRLRLDVLDVVDGRRHGALGDGDDRVLPSPARDSPL